MGNEIREEIDWVQFNSWSNQLLLSFDGQEKEGRESLECAFSRLTTNEERVKHCLQREGLANKVASLYEDMVSQFKNRPKDGAKAKERRMKGDEFYKKQDFEEALEHYNEALFAAPFPSTENGNQVEDIELSLAFANRSAAYFALEAYDCCLEDADHALAYGYPGDCHKLLIRRANCLRELDKPKEAHDLLESALKANENEAEIKELEKQLKQMSVSTKSTEAPGSEGDDEEEEEVSEEEEELLSTNPLLPRASDRVELCASSKGRFIRARDEVSFGDILFKETPVAWILHEDKLKSHCMHCMKPLMGGEFPCRGCEQIRFCSAVCSEKSIVYHRHECNGMINVYQHLGIGYLALRLVLSVGVERALEIYNRESALTQEINSKPYLSDYSSVVHLMDHQQDFEPRDNLRFTLAAIFLSSALKRHKLWDSKGSGDSIPLTCLLLKHLQQLSTNVFSVLDQAFSQGISMFGVDAREETIGVAVYPTMSLLNHSCLPNVMTFFDGSLFTMKASKTIAPGDEISYCYGPSMQGMSRKDRQNILKKQYFFDCDCKPCTDRTESTGRALLCPKCSGPLIYNMDHTSECLKCKATDVDVTQMLQLLDKCCLLADEGRQHLNKLRLDEAITNISECNNLMDSCLYRHNRQLCQIKDDMSRCLAMFGHFDVALKFAVFNLKVTKEIFGNESVEAANQMVKTISLNWHLIEEVLEEDAKKASLMGSELLLMIDTATELFKNFQTSSAEKLKKYNLIGSYSEELEELQKKREAVLSII